jgi:hypothetical protein
MEITYSRFEKSIEFPAPIEGASIRQDYSDGFLIIDVRRNRINHAGTSENTPTPETPLPNSARRGSEVCSTGTPVSHSRSRAGLQNLDDRSGNSNTARCRQARSLAAC